MRFNGILLRWSEYYSLKKNNVLKLQETLQADLEYWDPELLIQN